MQQIVDFHDTVFDHEDEHSVRIYIKPNYEDGENVKVVILDHDDTNMKIYTAK